MFGDMWKKIPLAIVQRVVETKINERGTAVDARSFCNERSTQAETWRWQGAACVFFVNRIVEGNVAGLSLVARHLCGVLSRCVGRNIEDLFQLRGIFFSDQRFGWRPRTALRWRPIQG